MPIRNGLCMDHIYAGVDDDAFLPLAQWIENIPGGKHDLVKSGDQSWEGIYVGTRTNAYFEMLRKRESGGIGFAFSAVKPSALDGREIVNEFPDLNWKKGSRVTAEGKPWFDWFSLCDYEDMEPFPPCNVWLMHYHMNHYDWPARRPKTIFDAITEMAVVGCQEMRQEIARVIPWTPIRIEEGADENIYYLPDRDESELRVRVRFEDFKLEVGNEFRFKHIEFRLAPDASTPPPPPSPWVMSVPHPGSIRLSLEK